MTSLPRRPRPLQQPMVHQHQAVLLPPVRAPRNEGDLPTRRCASSIPKLSYCYTLRFQAMCLEVALTMTPNSFLVCHRIGCCSSCQCCDSLLMHLHYALPASALTQCLGNDVYLTSASQHIWCRLCQTMPAWLRMVFFSYRKQRGKQLLPWQQQQQVQIRASPPLRPRSATTPRGI